jgi:two-component system nitrate/nitrite response regulator NarL
MLPSRSQRVAVVDQDAEHLRALLAVLGRQPGIELVGEGSDGYDLLWLAVSAQPDVLVCDLDLPGLDALSVHPLLRAVSPATRLVVFTANVTGLADPRAADVDAWVHRSGSVAALLATLHELALRDASTGVDLTGSPELLGQRSG